ncbi:hypothetical protein EJ110_NYTH11002 [Nymphaea thermarum]|nr:hypothetical protein EJ110_NYTH11002 [Nymphaea thermarum]
MEASTSMVVEDEEVRCHICLEGFGADREARETPCRHRERTKGRRGRGLAQTGRRGRHLAGIGRVEASTSMMVEDEDARCLICLEGLEQTGRRERCPADIACDDEDHDGTCDDGTTMAAAMNDGDDDGTATTGTPSRNERAREGDAETVGGEGKLIVFYLEFRCWVSQCR